MFLAVKNFKNASRIFLCASVPLAVKKLKKDKTMNEEKLLQTLNRIADALEYKPKAIQVNWGAASAFAWHAESNELSPVPDTGALPLSMLVGIEAHAKTLLQNTLQFAAGRPANNALLWGARGMGKSSLVKAVHAQVSKDHPLILIEIYREDLSSLPALLKFLKSEIDKRFLLYCDDLSFDNKDNSYKSLKTVLEGGIESRPDNVLFYATSNRRHLMPRDMIENERRTAIHGGESIEEKVSLSDRFGLWLGFYPCEQDQFFKMIENYAKLLDIKIDSEDLRAQALEWSMTRGSRSGRVAWQFMQHLAGLHGKNI